MTRQTTTTTEKVRAVLLATLMVVSVFGGTVAFAGSAAATANTGSFDSGFYAGNEEVSISVTDSSAAGNDAKIEELEVTVTSESGDEESVVLEETAQDSGMFEGGITTDVVSDSETLEKDNGLIEGVSGDSISLVSYGASAVLDGTAPSITDADIVDMRDGNTVVRVDFSEPVYGVEAEDFEFTGSGSVEWVTPDTAQDGYVELTFDREIQTGTDDSKLVVESGSYSDFAGNENSKESLYVDSVELELDEGMNFVSAPFEAGGVGFSAMEEKGLLDNVEVVWAYDQSSSGDGHWVSYDPDADKNELEYLYGGQGYVFVADKPDEIDLRSYTRVAADTGNENNVPGSPRVEGIEPGWNLVGHYHEGAKPVEGTEEATGAFGFGYDTEVGVLGQASDGSMQYVGEADIGEAYWVFTRDYGLYTPKQDDGGSSTSEMDLSATLTDENGDGIVTNGETVEVEYTATDDDGLYSVIASASQLGADAENTHLYGDDIESGTTDTITFEVSNQNTEEDEVTIPMFAEDVHGETEVVEMTVELDAVEPTVENFAPSDGSAVSSISNDEITFDVSDDGSGLDTSTLSVTVSDDTNGEQFSVTGVDSSAELTYDSGTVAVDVSGASLTEGDVTVEMSANDDAGNLVEDSATFELDTTDPSPSLTDVSDQTVQSDTSVTVTYDADSSDVQSVEVAIVDGDGNDVATTTGQTGTEVETSIDAPSDEGDYSVEVRATDDADNTGTSSQMGLTVDDTAPSISSFSVDNPESQTVEVSFDSNEQLSTISVSGTDDASGTTLNEGDFTESGDATNGYTYTATLSTGADGTFGATLDTAADAADNDGAGDESDSVSIDETVQVTGLTASDAGSQDVAIMVESDEQLSGLTVSLSGPESDSLSGVGDAFTETENDDGSYTYEATYTGSSDGDYTVSLDSASDTNSNTDSSPGLDDTVTIDTTVDTTDLTANNPESQDVEVVVTANEQLTDLSASDGDGNSISGVGTDGDFTETENDDGSYTYTAAYDAGADGDYTVTLDSATDANGNSDSSPGLDDTVTIDTTSPTISSVSLDNDGSNNLALSFDSDEQLGSDAGDLAVSVDGPSTTDANTFDATDFSMQEDSGTYTYTLDTAQAYDDGDGTYTASVDDAMDAAGNNGGNNGDGEGLTASYTLDTTGPSVSIDSPEDGASVTSQDSITGTASDETTSVSQVELTIQRSSDNSYWDGSSWGSSETSVTASGTDSWTYDSSAISGEDTYTVTATATDEHDNEQTSAAVSYTIDKTSPTISNYGITNDDPTNTQDVTVSFDSDEDLDAVEATVEVDGTQVGTLSLSNGDFTENGGTYTATYSGSSDGDYTITLHTAADAAGNDGASSQSDTVTVDTQTTDASISASFDSSTDEITVEVSADEPVDTSTLEVNLQDAGSDVDTSLTSWTDQGGNTYTATYEVTESAEEDYTATLTTATDEAGNSMVADTPQSDTASVDTASASMTDATGATDSNQVTVTFSEGVGVNQDGTGALTESDLTYADNTAGSATSIDWSATTSNGDLDATDGSITLVLDAQPNNEDLGSDQIELTSPVYDAAGNELASGATVTITT